MKRRNLKVLQGGLSPDLKKRPRHFVSAYVTNTRLMGVLAVYARWHISSNCSNPDDDPYSGALHQFFYIDCEETGLETYKGIRGDREADVEMAEQALIGGLGADKIELTERELLGLICRYRNFNARHRLPMPQGIDEYGFLLDPETHLSKEENTNLMGRICDAIKTDYQAINYFLMRCLGRDYEVARYLTASGNFPLDFYDHYIRATFCKNVIDREKCYGDGAVSYLCESLVEMNGKYDSVISKVIVRDLKIIGFEHCSRFHVSTTEAAMMLAKPEYCTVYEVLLTEEEIENNIGEFTLGLKTTMSTHDSGRLFMAFKQNNDHVSERVFMLSNDVSGIYFLTDFGQLVTAAYSISDIRKLESALSSSPLSPYLQLTAKYEFRESVLLEFIHSGFEDFDDFLNFLKK